MARPPFRIPREGRPLLEPFSAGRKGPSEWRGFTRAQIEQIARTVCHTPEVMVKVTGGGTKIAAVAAHLTYIGRKGALEIETDDGQRITGRTEQKAILADWHLELSAGQYRQPGTGRAAARATKLVHNIVLSMPAPVPPEKVLAAARKFAREKFGAKHRYAMVLHTDQRHPHVHMVVKAESEDGARLHIDKPMLREWRSDFAALMREQGVAANATPRALRGRAKATMHNGLYRAQERGRAAVVRERVWAVANELRRTGRITDAGRPKLVETRNAVTLQWMRVAEILDAQGQRVLAGQVRYFARHLPPVLTDKERIAVGLRPHIAKVTARQADLTRNQELTR